MPRTSHPPSSILHPPPRGLVVTKSTNDQPVGAEIKGPQLHIRPANQPPTSSFIHAHPNHQSQPICIPCQYFDFLSLFFVLTTLTTFKNTILRWCVVLQSADSYSDKPKPKPPSHGLVAKYQTAPPPSETLPPRRRPLLISNRTRHGPFIVDDDNPLTPCPLSLFQRINNEKQLSIQLLGISDDDAIPQFHPKFPP